MSSLSYVLAACMLLVALVNAQPATKPSIGWRLDDIQCGWMTTQQQSIVNAFVTAQVPLTVGIITGPGDCYLQWLQPIVAANPTLIEVASHSTTHLLMDGPNIDYQKELFTSRTLLQSQFPSQSISHFIPPYNNWNLSVAAAVKAAGYSTMSEECTVGLVQPFSASAGMDDLCSTNMYPSVQYPFFQKMPDGLYHIPTGASTASFVDINGIPVNISQLFNGSNTDCTQNSICSVQSQMNKMSSRLYAAPSGTSGNASPVTFSVVMMHPQDFSQWTDAQITPYFAEALAYSKANFNAYTLTGLIDFTGGVNSSSSSTGGGGGGSSGSSSTGASSSQSSSGAGTMMSSASTQASSSSSASSQMSSSASSSQASSSSSSSGGVMAASSSSSASGMSTSSSSGSTIIINPSTATDEASQQTGGVSGVSGVASSASSRMSSSSSASSMMRSSTGTSSSSVSAASSSRAIGGVMVAMVAVAGAMLML